MDATNLQQIRKGDTEMKILNITFRVSVIILLGLLVALQARTTPEEIREVETKYQTTYRFIVVPSEPEIITVDTHTLETRYIPYEVRISVPQAEEPTEEPTEEPPEEPGEPTPIPPDPPEPPPTMILDETHLYAYFYSAGELYPVDCGKTPNLLNNAFSQSLNVLFGETPEGYSTYIPPDVKYINTSFDYGGFKGITVSQEIADTNPADLEKVIEQIEATVYWTLGRFEGEIVYSGFDIFYFKDGIHHSLYDLL